MHSWMTKPDCDTATLARQCYGIRTAQSVFGGPSGIWLECKGCRRSDVIVGSANIEWVHVTDAEAATVFRRHGWTGEGDKLLKALCPTCSPAEWKDKDNG